MKKIIFLLLFFISFGWSFSQVTNNYHNFSVNEGLPSSQVYSMTEDSYGYLWFFTDHGASRYDGYNFENFNKSDGLTDDVIFNCFKHNDEIWVIGQDYSITIINGRTPKFRTYQFNDSVRKYGNYNSKDIFIDHDENLHIKFALSTGALTLNKNGIVLQKPEFNKQKNKPVCISIYEKSFTIQTLSLDKTSSSSPYNYNSHFTKTKGIALSDSNFAFIKGDSTVEFISNTKSNSIYQPDNALNIGKTNNFNYWVSYIGNGIIFYNTVGTEITHLFQSKTVTNFYIDKEKNRWFSTLNNGIYMLPSNQFNTIKDLSNSNNISDLEVFNDKLFVGYKSGSVYELQNRNLHEIFVSKKKKPIIFAKNTKENALFFIGDIKLIEYKNGTCNFLSSTQYPYQLKFINDNLLGFSGYSGFFEYKNKKLVPIVKLKKTYDFTSYHNQFYLGSNSGLYKIGENGEEINLSTIRIKTLVLINDLLFIGTHGDGLYIYNGNNFELKIDANSLKGGYISCIKQQNENTVWIGTNTGLCQIVFNNDSNITDYSITDFSNFIPEKEVTDLEIINDTLWIATNNGLYFTNVNTEQNKKINSTNYNLEIDQVSINDHLIVTSNLNIFDYDENRLTIKYKAISFKQKHNILYRYKLVGLESDWNYSEKQNITYASIPPGSYVFIIQTKENNKSWHEQQESLNILIKKPFWKTELFIVCSIAFLVILIYLFFKYRILLYNKDIVRELLRHFLKAIQRNEKSIIIKVSGSEVKIITDDILYVKSDGNYLEIHTHSQKYLTREKISNFIKLVPDPIEFLQVRRSHIVRLDKITEKGKKHIMINDVKIQVGETYLEKLKLIDFSRYKS
jgi:hypothetical protein